MVKTSVIIPVYNTEKYLDQCLTSVLGQGQKDLEIVAVDDGSTDGSLKILERYADQYPNITLLKQENKKQGCARNEGLRKARGQYLLFLDSDDYIDSDTIEVCHHYAELYHLDAVLFDAKVFADGNLPAGFVMDSFDRRDIIKDVQRVYSGKKFLKEYMNFYPDTVSPCMMYISKEFLVKHKLHFLEQVFYEDEEFRFHLMLNAKRVMYLPRLFYNRRYRCDSTMTSEYSEEKHENFIYVINEMINDIQDSDKDEVAKTYIEKRFWMLVDRYKQLKEKSISERNLDRILQLLDHFWIRCEMPSDIEDVKFRLYFIQHLRSFVPEEWLKGAAEEAERQRFVLLGKSNLGDSNLKIGIFGKPEFIDRLLNGYRTYIGDVKASIITITDPECKQNNLDCIIVVSDSETERTYDKLKGLYENRIPVLRLADVSGNFLF